MSRRQSRRLPDGGLLDRSRLLLFECNGRQYAGHPGDTLASALLANGVRLAGRSFKLHRPRGVMSAGVEETNALFSVDTGSGAVPLVRATLQPLVDGLVATTDNAWPGLSLDAGRLLDFTHGLWPAGFYYKTFKWPGWRWYEGALRRISGAGRPPAGADPVRCHQHNLHCDRLVVGGGRAGLDAALQAAGRGERVVLVEQEPRLGGRLLWDDCRVGAEPGSAWLARAERALRASPQAIVLTATQACGHYDHGVLLAVDRSDADARQPVERLWKIRARQVVLATGAIEQPLVFANNDRPGILLAGAVRRYLRQYAVAAGRRVVVATNNDDAWRTAFALQAAGLTVPAIVDARAAPPAGLLEAAASRGIETLCGAMVTDTAGGRGLRSVEVRGVSGDGSAATGKVRRIRCDALAMSGGWAAALQLYSQARGRLRYDDTLGCFLPDAAPPALEVAGAAAGESSRYGGILPWRRAPGARANRQWVDFRHDVTAADIELAARENYVAAEHMKRYTTAGMSVDQGKTSSLNALAILAARTGREAGKVGTTTARPMYSPVSLGAIAAGRQGPLYSPRRLLPVHDWHAGHGAEFDDYGGWRRPACYRRPGESRDGAILREVLAVRRAVGLFDASPLGKIEVRGPDAAEFLDRFYVNNLRTLQPGRVRYGLMTDENGIVIDDGVVGCLAPDHYLVGTSSAGAGRIAAWLEEWQQCEWPALKVLLLPVTAQWAVLTLAGPWARELLQGLDTDIDFSASVFPHLGIRQGWLAGSRLRVQRVSFSGELSFELAVPAQRASALWQALIKAGSLFGIEPVGIEAILMLRMEKGFLHVGVDTDGSTNPRDLGFGPAIDRKPGDFIGRRSLQRAEDRRPDRRQWVGLRPLDERAPLRAGAHVVESVGGRMRSCGFVTSAGPSPTLGYSIGLGRVERGFARIGDVVTLYDEGREMPARIVAPGFYDPGGERMRG